MLDVEKLWSGIWWLICLVFLKFVPYANKTKQKWQSRTKENKKAQIKFWLLPNCWSFKRKNKAIKIRMWMKQFTVIVSQVTKSFQFILQKKHFTFKNITSQVVGVILENALLTGFLIFCMWKRDAMGFFPSQHCASSTED